IAFIELQRAAVGACRLILEDRAVDVERHFLASEIARLTRRIAKIEERARNLAAGVVQWLAGLRGDQPDELVALRLDDAGGLVEYVGTDKAWQALHHLEASACRLDRGIHFGFARNRHLADDRT